MGECDGVGAVHLEVAVSPFVTAFAGGKSSCGRKPAPGCYRRYSRESRLGEGSQEVAKSCMTYPEVSCVSACIQAVAEMVARSTLVLIKRVSWTTGLRVDEIEDARSPSSTELNSLHHAGRTSLKQSMLKIGNLAGGWKPLWAQGVGGRQARSGYTASVANCAHVRADRN